MVKKDHKRVHEFCSNLSKPYPVGSSSNKLLPEKASFQQNGLSGSIITVKEELKQVFVLTDRKPVPVVMTGQEVSMEEQESSITYHTVWEVIIISLTNGSSPLISGWPGELLTCMNYIATEMNSDPECLSKEILPCTPKGAINGYLPSVTAIRYSVPEWTVTCNG